MARILILIGGHLWANPRPQKEADALADAGYDVTISGMWLDPIEAQMDLALASGRAWRFKPFLDLRPARLGRIRNVIARLRNRVARGAYLRWGIRSPALLGYGTREMLRAAIRSRTDLTIVRSEAGMWVGKCLLDRGQKVGVDFEDWYSEDIWPDERESRPIQWLRVLESRVARDCVYSITTSKAMAEAIAGEYQVPAPDVIYNVFPLCDRASVNSKYRDRRNPNLRSVHWFSQTIGPNRGLELLFRAARDVTVPFEIHLRGKLSAAAGSWLQAIVPPTLQPRVFTHGTVPSSALLSHISEHDVGLALEASNIRSRNLTITNKLFQYLQAGLAVIATDTAGQREVFSQAPNVGLLVRNNDPDALARALNQLLSNKEHLSDAKQAASAAFNDKFCWDLQSKTVVRLVNRAMSGIRNTNGRAEPN